MKKKRKKIITEKVKKGKDIKQEVFQHLNKLSELDPDFISKIKKEEDFFSDTFYMVSLNIRSVFSLSRTESNELLGKYIEESQKDENVEKINRYITENIEAAKSLLPQTSTEAFKNAIKDRDKQFIGEDIKKSVEVLSKLYSNIFNDEKEANKLPSNVYFPCPFFQVSVCLDNPEPKHSSIYFYDGSDWIASLEIVPENQKPWRVRMVLGGGKEITERFYTTKINGLEKMITHIMTTYFFRNINIDFVEPI